MITQPMNWKELKHYNDPPDITMDAELTILQMFIGDLNLNIEPQSRMVQLRRRLENGYTNLVIFFDLTDTDDGPNVTITLPVHYLHQLTLTPATLVKEMPVGFIIYPNEKGVEEVKRCIPNRWNQWEEHFKTQEKEFPEAFLFVIDPIQIRTYEHGRPFMICHVFSMLNYFNTLYTVQWIKHLEEQCKMTREEIKNQPITVFEREQFVEFFEQLNLKNIESGFPSHAKKAARMFINVKRETRITRRAKRRLAAQAAAATKALRRKQMEEEEGGEEDTSQNLNESASQDDTSMADTTADQTSESVNEGDGQKTEEEEKDIKTENETEEMKTVAESEAVQECEREIKQELVEELYANPTSSIADFRDRLEVDEALEAEAPDDDEPRVAAAPRKKRKKCKKIGAPQKRKRVQKSLSYNPEDEEILLIESELKRQNGENSDSDVSEELGEPSECRSTPQLAPPPAKRGRWSRTKKE